MDGSHSQFPLVKLAARYNEMRKEGRLLSLRGTLEVVRHRITVLAERIDLNEAPDRLAVLSKLWEKFRQQEQNGNSVEAVVTKREIDTAFAAAREDYAAWQQMFDAIDLDRKLVESEVKIIKEIRATLTAEDAYKLTAQLLGIIIETVNAHSELTPETKSDLLKRIAYEFTKLVGDGINTKNVIGVERRGPEVIDPESGDLDTERIPDPGNPT